MVKVSTLVYVLENLEQEKNELFDVNEIFELEESLLGKISGILDPSESGGRSSQKNQYCLRKLNCI